MAEWPAIFPSSKTDPNGLTVQRVPRSNPGAGGGRFSRHRDVAQRGENELGGDRDCGLERPIHRTAVAINPVNPLGCLAVCGRRPEIHSDMNSPDHQHAILLLDLSHRVCREPVTRRGDLARLQRAS